MEKIFFSYSREDSEFALELARDMRSAGQEVGLDQLDIPAGALAFSLSCSRRL